MQGLARETKEFCRFLLECAKSCKGGKPWEGRIRSVRLRSDDYSVMVFPSGARTVFDEFCGPQETELVVVYQSKEEEEEVSKASPDNDYSCKSPEHAPDESRDAPRAKTPPPSSPPLPFSVVHSPEVKVGKLLPSQRVFLTKTIPFYIGQSSTSTLHLVTFSDSRVAPISLDKARYLCSLYSLGARKPRPLPTMWVICACEHQRSKIITLGCSIADQLLNIVTISAEQRLSDGSSGKRAARRERRISGRGMWAFSEYDITGCVDDDTKASPAATKSPSLSQAVQITIQFAWPDPESLLAPPPDSAEGLIRISVSPGNVFSPVLSVYQELSSLIQLSKVALGEVEWLECDQEHVIDSAVSVETRVEKFLEESAMPYECSLDATLVTSLASSTVYEPRKDLDFVERLWMCCKDSRSLRELQEFLAAVFKAFILGKVQPFVHKKSDSTLATLFREVLQCPAFEDRQALASKFNSLLSGTKALDCLVEIGVEKLKSDYYSFFVYSDLATISELEPFLSVGETGAICDSLYKLHCVMELVTATLFFLKLPSETLLSLTKAALDHYKKASMDNLSPSPSFSISLEAFSQALKSMCSLCSKLSPTTFTTSEDSQHWSKRSLKAVRSKPLFGEGPGADNSIFDLCSYVYTGECGPVSLAI